MILSSYIIILHNLLAMISPLPAEERTNQMPYKFTLNKNIILRGEDFGGLVFNRKTGDTLDVDKELFALLELLRPLEQIEEPDESIDNDLSKGLNVREMNMLLKNSGFSASQSELIEVLKKLVKLQVVDYRFVNPGKREARTGSSQIKNRKTSEAVNLKVFENPKGIKESRIKESRKTNALNTSNSLSIPETVHWAVTYRCNSDCPDCYARRHKDSFPEMNTREAKTMIDRLADAGVFQLANLGVMIDFHKDRAVVSFYCTLDYGAAIPVLDNQGRDYRYYEEVDSFELEDYLNNDRLFKLLFEVRQQLTTGDYRAFKVFWDVYGRPLYDEEAIQELKLPYDNNFDITTLPDNLKQLWNMLAVV